MDILEFMGKAIFEDIPEFIFDKIPRDTEKTLDNLSEAIDKFLEN